MWIRCLVIVSFGIAVPWTVGARIGQAGKLLWLDLRADMRSEWRAARRAWRNKTFD